MSVKQGAGTHEACRARLAFEWCDSDVKMKNQIRTLSWKACSSIEGELPMCAVNERCGVDTISKAQIEFLVDSM